MTLPYCFILWVGKKETREIKWLAQDDKISYDKIRISQKFWLCLLRQAAFLHTNKLIRMETDVCNAFGDPKSQI